MEPNQPRTDEAVFESTIQALQAELTNIAAHLTIDTKARSLYAQEIKSMSDKLRSDAVCRRISWGVAARQAQEARNVIMGVIRERSTPVGRAFAESLKRTGLSLNQLIALKTASLYGKQAIFSRLSESKQNLIYASIVKSAGNSNARVTRAMKNLTHAA
ncbi:hypothetical protein ACLB1G_19970 [Oxalobacteraceae bacterium A2-2]